MDLAGQVNLLLERLPALASFNEECEWLEDAAAWVRDVSDASRLNLLLDALDTQPQARERFTAILNHVFDDTDATRLFTDTGLPSQHGFFAETLDRFMKNVLPEPPVERDLARLLVRLFPNRRAAEWFARLDAISANRLLAFFSVGEDRATQYFQRALRDAAVLIGIRIAAHGTSDEVRERSDHLTLDTSAFLQLPRVVRARLGYDGKASDDDVKRAIVACREEMQHVVATLDTTGVSVNLVYRLEVIDSLLFRLKAIVTLISVENTPAGSPALPMLRALIWGGVRDRSVFAHLQRGSQLLARRVIERAGVTGDHYITRTRKEQHEMVTSAGGGGALTAIAIVLKFVIAWMKLPVLIEAFSIGMNYALGFIAMQLAHFTLATKQPSMTAATLAGAIRETQGDDERDLAPLVDLVERTVRSQLAAAIGNIGVVIPSVLAIDGLWWLVSHHHFLDAKYADKIIHAHHPFLSATIFYASMTGVFLWMSSLIAGGVENWFVMRKLPGAIASNRALRALFGRARAQRLADFLTKQISGFAGNGSLGFILAFAPALAALVGIPLEVRHITFVTGQLAFAGLQRGAEGVLRADYLWCLTSIGWIGLCNFGVSFALALAVAFRARGVRMREQLELVRAVWTRFRTRPMNFIRAPIDPPRPESAQA